MSKAIHFEKTGSVAIFRLSGQVSLPQAVQLVTSAITSAREQGIAELLVNISELTGFASPTIRDRYSFAQEWAHAAQGKLCVAFVARAEIIDPHKIGVIFAANYGLIAEVFSSEQQALVWLQQPWENIKNTYKVFYNSK